MIQDHTSKGRHAATQQNTEYYLRVLHELIDIGVSFARRLHQQACPPAEASQPVAASPSPATTQDLSIAFDRISRAIRRTIALAQKLSEPVEAQTAPGQSARKRNNIRVVNDAYQPDEVDASKLTDEQLQERIDRFDRELDRDLDDEDDVTSRPFADIVADICRDLGIAHVPDTHIWKRCIVADIADILKSSQAHTLRTSAPTSGNVVAIHPRNASSKTTDPPQSRGD